MRPVLTAVSDAPRTMSEVLEAVWVYFWLTEDERLHRLASGKQTEIKIRIGRACMLANDQAFKLLMQQSLQQVVG